MPAGSENADMNWRRLLMIALVVVGVIALAGFVLIMLWVPTLSTYRLVAFIACMFAVTGAVVAVAVAVITGQGDR